MNSFKINDIDRLILKKLLEDARTSFSVIAKECGVSVTAVVKRFNKMKNLGIINGTTLVLDLSDTRKEFALAITIDLVKKEREEEVVGVMKKIPNIITCDPKIGKHDLYASAYARSIQDIQKIRDKIKKISGVKEIGITANLDTRFYFTENILK